MTNLERAAAMHEYLKDEERKQAEKILEAYRRIDDTNAVERAVKIRNILNEDNKRK